MNICRFSLYLHELSTAMTTRTEKSFLHWLIDCFFNCFLDPVIAGVAVLIRDKRTRAQEFCSFWQYDLDNLKGREK
jgi:hypothetical protein